jgi:hypothetical protein
MINTRSAAIKTPGPKLKGLDPGVPEQFLRANIVDLGPKNVWNTHKGHNEHLMPNRAAGANDVATAASGGSPPAREAPPWYRVPPLTHY